ncbi:translation factor GTPase family protein [Fusibacter ferrireducens]|uniref:TetM/TetW/TetO/TetS family tetracycline resistance ribosomal protection protein n=1 Tax=Fusibacter ferrireducens TaxID=2785058 RepID=A0ABR9ZQ81_9FIRM|nr:TetM/TetW/TetO/TetS family tetracycline resistance ribosomal protection protein [Fusibacter ferrireducens]MBF4692574.1 TetM/TetW/TetO/TetS family tetracycline resistance ribosomal protection protein [Fusibacter ferrireducens]
MRKLVIGILAHVDAGKTTLSESMLFLSGKIRQMGRVDNKDAYLDTFELEKTRGITIFSKQAIFNIKDTEITLMDTPGHVDFSAEMERTLQVLDYAILVISGADGVQGHTKTLWRLLRIYKIPTFIFVNKMDQNGTDQEAILADVKKNLGDNCIDFGIQNLKVFSEEIALCDETVMEAYLETDHVSIEQIREMVKNRSVFPVFFGSALKLQGVEVFMEAINDYVKESRYPTEFGAKVFKISRDDQGNRLTHMKLTGGALKVREALQGTGWTEKVNQIRIYSGQKFSAVNEIRAGAICAVTGLNLSKPGEGLGIEASSMAPILEPVLSYKIVLPEGMDERLMLPKLRLLEEEEPEFHFMWDEELQEIKVQIMGEVQLEILQALIEERFDVSIYFGEGRIVYKEKIVNVVEGVGHFEPLRHYAEVHLLMEPGEKGSGIQVDSLCSEEVLDKNWQRLVLSHLKEKVHRGVLTGSAITDMKITLVAGRAHNKHTEGGDFREATYRAVRQGLMEADSILLEPYYAFQLELPENLVGRAMTDVENMHGTCTIAHSDGEIAMISGRAPVATMRNYQKEVIAYSKGQGLLFLNLEGYDSCHNASEIIDQIAYDPIRDSQNPTGSVFCAHGSGFSVPWDEVKTYMHVEGYLKSVKTEQEIIAKEVSVKSETEWLSLEEIDQIINSTYNANQGKKSAWKAQKKRPKNFYESTAPPTIKKPKTTTEAYLLVDGYNIIFAWPDLKALAADNLDAARMKLMDILSNYQGMCKNHIIVVFDAYRLEGRRESIEAYHNIHVVFTGEAQTADHYIEKFAHAHQDKYHITVATSDGLQQVIIRGAGCALLSARELMAEIKLQSERLKADYLKQDNTEQTALEDTLSASEKEKIEALIRKP